MKPVHVSDVRTGNSEKNFVVLSLALRELAGVRSVGFVRIRLGRMTDEAS